MYGSDKFFSPLSCEPPEKKDEKDLRSWAAQWSKALWFHWFKSILLWSFFGILPYMLGVRCTMTNLFWLDLIPWLVCGWLLGLKFLTQLNYHHLISGSDVSHLKIRGLVTWVFIYPAYAIDFAAMSIL